MRILIVEDDETLGRGILTGLKQAGFSCEWYNDGNSAREILNHQIYDVIVLDLGLPKVPGLRILSELRSREDKTPVLILTARDTVEDRIKGLEIGADDYMVKPFDLGELIARIKAIQRRSVERVTSKIIYKDIVIDTDSRLITFKNESVSLPRREFALLQKLLENQGKVLSRDQLTQSLYTWEQDVDSNALEVHIHSLRKKFGSELIKTIRGIGYMVPSA